MLRLRALRAEREVCRRSSSSAAAAICCSSSRISASMAARFCLRLLEPLLVPRLQRLAVERGLDDRKQGRDVGSPQGGHAQRADRSRSPASANAATPPSALLQNSSSWCAKLSRKDCYTLAVIARRGCRARSARAGKCRDDARNRQARCNGSQFCSNVAETNAS